MLYEIVHRTRYRYSNQVFLEPLTVMLRPRNDASQTLHRHSIDVTPRPSGISNCVGLNGNYFNTIWFNGLHNNLMIEVKSLVETHYGDPFNFLIIDPLALKLPLVYNPHLAFLLGPYLIRDSNDDQVAMIAQKIKVNANHETIPFLTLLAAYIPNCIKYMLREHGNPWTPGETIRQGQGSCRDFAVLYIDICRSLGIAARFVSGYCFGEVAANNHMHAWVEVYLPGAGWRGFDPSRGAATSDDYITVSAGQSFLDAAPTLGSFRGEAISTLTAEITITPQ